MAYKDPEISMSVNLLKNLGLKSVSAECGDNYVVA